MIISAKVRSSTVFFAVGATFWLSAGAFGQGACLPDNPAVSRNLKLRGDLEVLCQESKQALVDPSLESPTRRTELQAQVLATREDESAAIEFRLGTDKNCSQCISTIQHSLKLSGPIGKDETEADLATLKGLQANTKIGYNLSWRSVDPIRAFLAVDAAKWNTLLCQALKQDNKIAADTDCESAEIGGLFFEKLTYGGEGYNGLLRTLGLARGSFLVGLEATYAAPAKFEFVTTDSLEPHSEEHDGFAATLGVGWLPYRRAFYHLGLSFRYEDGYKGQGEQEICQPFGEGLGALSCAKHAVGAPEKSQKRIGSLELQRYFRGGSLAVNPRYSYDFESKVSGFQLPVYFLKDGKGNLNGGIAAGWRSDTEDYTLSLFIGSMKNPFK